MLRNFGVVRRAFIATSIGVANYSSQTGQLAESTNSKSNPIQQFAFQGVDNTAANSSKRAGR
jgi:hypothetical protein